ncbi:MAG: HEAT repeat domain-containing protein [Myxococcales bacterium]|jgi:HEAT repeat protein|nr:HEAT repeat domain-containing protein [Myxococcales bacterium]
MGIFSFFSPSPEKRIQSLRKKIQERYGQPEGRQQAIDKLLDMGTPEAIGALLSRFTVNVEPSITDAEEKEYLFKSIVEMGDKAVPPIEAFLKRSDDAASWAIRLLSQLISEEALVALCIEVLERIGPDYARDPEKKQVLLCTLAKKEGSAIPAAIVPFLKDPSDEVRIEAAYALAKHNDEASSREPLLDAFVDSTDRNRVIAAITNALVETGFGVQGYREKIEQGLPAGFAVNREGKVTKQSS